MGREGLKEAFDEEMSDFDFFKLMFLLRNLRGMRLTV
jgi:hypothetical protein